jgi:large subunit ribosomal protein L38e
MGLTKMPKQIYDVEKFLELTEDAVECRIKRSGDKVKYKLRTARYLYTIILEPQEAENIRSRIKCTIVEAHREEGEQL